MDQIINLFHYYKQAADIPDHNWNQDRLLRTLKEYCIRPHLFFRAGFIAQRPVALIGGFLSEDPVDDELAATIQFLYCLDEHSSIEHYQQLISGFQDWAGELGATAIRAIDIGQNPNRLQDIYRELGFDPIRISIMNKEIQ